MGGIATGFAAAAMAAAISTAALLYGAAPAKAQSCPGNPDALGTSRVLAVGAAEYSRLGRMQYPQTLPLAEREVVLTFDDGPLPPYSNEILDILAGQCVKATYFMVGRMARDFPAIVRRTYAQGHSIGTHTEDHPFRMRNLPVDRVRQEIDDGIVSVDAALGDPAELAPFFRIPGLERSGTIESELASRALVTFSADAVADDWFRQITPKQIVARAISRLEARGSGILLLHDIHPATVAALPELLKELKEHGFHIVHLVPAAAPAPSQTPPRQADVEAQPGEAALPAPDAAAFALFYPAEPIVSGAAQKRGGYWPSGPNETEASLITSHPQLPAPGVADLGISFKDNARLTATRVTARARLSLNDKDATGAEAIRN
jgi:peptidoglycan/xylan/chitin deacetylase (PgdA/CDA1 family)